MFHHDASHHFVPWAPADEPEYLSRPEGDKLTERTAERPTPPPETLPPVLPTKAAASRPAQKAQVVLPVQEPIYKHPVVVTAAAVGVTWALWKVFFAKSV